MEVRFGPAVVDAEGVVLGRFASYLAKRLLMGENIVVVNAEKAVITGEPRMVKERYLSKRLRGDPHKGPFYPRYPDKLLKRVVRGMLPYKQQKGRQALARLKVYMGVPKEYQGKAQKVGKSVNDLSCKYITLAELCKTLGAKAERWEYAG